MKVSSQQRMNESILLLIERLMTRVKILEDQAGINFHACYVINGLYFSRVELESLRIVYSKYEVVPGVCSSHLQALKNLADRGFVKNVKSNTGAWYELTAKGKKVMESVK